MVWIPLLDPFLKAGIGIVIFLGIPRFERQTTGVPLTIGWQAPHVELPPSFTAGVPRSKLHPRCTAGPCAPNLTQLAPCTRTTSTTYRGRRSLGGIWWSLGAKTSGNWTWKLMKPCKKWVKIKSFFSKDGNLNLSHPSWCFLHACFFFFPVLPLLPVWFFSSLPVWWPFSLYTVSPYLLLKQKHQHILDSFTDWLYQKKLDPPRYECIDLKIHLYIDRPNRSYI